MWPARKWRSRGAIWNAGAPQFTGDWLFTLAELMPQFGLAAGDSAFLGSAVDQGGAPAGLWLYTPSTGSLVDVEIPGEPLFWATIDGQAGVFLIASGLPAFLDTPQSSTMAG